MGGIRFSLGIHAYQPVGNLPEVFAEAHRRSHVPFLQILSEFPQIPFSLDISGVLFDWLEDALPDFLGRLAARLELDPPARLRRTPVQTISQSEAGCERVARQVALLPPWVLGGPDGVQTLARSLTLESWEAAAG
ncbi:MAG TPA: alpha-amylase/4-alpha-glucanotransferase domain-containing protein [Candidatus Acidoferrum sp.]|nr:alpha-amylase/4-alpha-glucanotransferase domain-containing protein [Candidatus Acidoferrum sp.]